MPDPASEEPFTTARGREWVGKSDTAQKHPATRGRATACRLQTQSVSCCIFVYFFFHSLSLSLSLSFSVSANSWWLLSVGFKSSKLRKKTKKNTHTHRKTTSLLVPWRCFAKLFFFWCSYTRDRRGPNNNPTSTRPHAFVSYNSHPHLRGRTAWDQPSGNIGTHRRTRYDAVR